MLDIFLKNLAGFIAGMQLTEKKLKTKCRHFVSKNILLYSFLNIFSRKKFLYFFFGLKIV